MGNPILCTVLFFIVYVYVNSNTQLYTMERCYHCILFLWNTFLRFIDNTTDITSLALQDVV